MTISEVEQNDGPRVIGDARRLPSVIVWALITAWMHPVAANGTDGGQFECTISSDQQKGTAFVFDPDEKVLYWGQNAPKRMIVTFERNDPLEIKAETQGQTFPPIALRIWRRDKLLSFVANAGDSLFTGVCERQQ